MPSEPQTGEPNKPSALEGLQMSKGKPINSWSPVASKLNLTLLCEDVGQSGS